jgi:hypothetical protein
MAIVMNMHWAGVTPEQYDQGRALVRWEEDPAPGGIHHVVWFDAEGMHACDVWETAEDFQRFVQDRLMPGVAQLGIEGQPEVTIHEAYREFAPGYLPKS